MTNRALAGSASLVCVAFVALSLAAARPARADTQLGAIGQLVITDGGTSINNLNTGTPFTAAKNLKVSIQCPDAGAWLALDGRTTCVPGYPCFQMPAGAMIDDTVRAPKDGGTRGVIAMSCLAGATSCTCNVIDNSVNYP